MRTAGQEGADASRRPFVQAARTATSTDRHLRRRSGGWTVIEVDTNGIGVDDLAQRVRVTALRH
jgi:hypothetical protein